MESSKARRQQQPKKSAVMAFNSSRNQLAKLPMLLKYIAKNVDKKDLTFQIHLSEGESLSESQWEVLECFLKRLTPEERNKNFERIVMYCFARYSTFSVDEQEKDDHSTRTGFWIRIKN